MGIDLITADDEISPFPGDRAELLLAARPGVRPDGNRLYLSFRRGTSGSAGGGITYCVTGPFRT